MTAEILLKVFLFGIALSMDAFAVSVTQGLTITDLNKKRMVFIAIVYGVCQALFPLIGYWVIELIQVIVTNSVGASQGQEIAIKAGQIMSTVVSWLSFGLLLFIGGKMLIEAILSLKKPEEEKPICKFSYKTIFIMGVATAIDALATGVAFHSGSISTQTTIWLHASIIMVCTFIISLLGVILARQIHKLLKGKYEITSIIGGIILISLGIWVIISHYVGI